MRNFRGKSTIAALALFFGLMNPQPATASYWNSYEIVGIGQYTTSNVQFTVLVSGDEPICEMTYGNQTLNQGPWNFTFELNNLNQFVLATTCDGMVQYEELQTVVPWTLMLDLVSLEYFPNFGKTTASVEIENHVDEAIDVTIRNGSNQILGTAIKATGAIVDVNFKTKFKAPTNRLTAEIVGQSSGMRSTIPFTAIQKWNGSYPAYKKCSTVYWSYDHSKAPKGVKLNSMLSDIVGGLKRVAALSGLSFVQAPTSDPDHYGQELTFDWRYTNKDGAGPNVAVSKGEAISFNLQRVRGQALDKIAGFKKGKRGWIVVHEVLHSLGMDHTAHKAEVMYVGGSWYMSNFGKGDIAGLTYLYEPKSCSR